MRETIFIAGLSNIGDAILTVPAMAAVRHAHPEAEITVLVGPRAAELFQGDPRWNRLVVYHRTWPWRTRWAILRELMAQRFDRVIDFRQGAWARLLQPWRWHPLGTAHGRRHRVEAYLDLVKSPGGAASANAHLPRDSSGRQDPLIWTSPQDEAKARAWMGRADGARRIAVAPGARSHLKRWPAASYAALIARLVEEYHAAIYVVGDQEDQPVVEEVIMRAACPVVNLCGHTSLRELAALLKGCQLVVTNDSAPLHLACAVGAPVVAIFGPTDEAKYGPWHPTDRVARKRLSCTPCEQSLCRYRHECMEWLTVDEVWKCVEKILGSDLHQRSRGVEGLTPA